MPNSYESYMDAADAFDKGEVKTREKIEIADEVTTAGKAKINNILPDGFKVEGKLDEDALTDILHRLSQEKPKEYTDVANELRKLGERATYKSGFSVGIDDIELMEGRDEIVEDAKNALDNIDVTNKDEVKRVGGKRSEEIEEKLRNQLQNSDNNFYDMVEAGARGNIDQLQQMLATPMMMVDSNNDPVPVAISKSYGEGLDIPDYWTSLYGARKGIIDRRLQQKKPGEISKFLLKTVNDQVITEDDCGTTDGITKDLDNSSIIGQVVAQGVGSIIQAGQVVTQDVINTLRQNDHEKIKVRSPIHCEAKKGICKKCYGQDEFGSLPDIGDNVGVKSGQAIGEPISQMTMNTFHTGGIVKGVEDEDVTAGLPRIDQLLRMPSSINDEATISEEAGKIKKIDDREGGGKEIIVEDEQGEEYEHFAPSRRNLLVDEGDEVFRADKLTSGVPDPKKLIKKVGISETRERLSDELKDAYSDFDIDDSIFETITKGVTDLVRVKDPGEEDDLLPGDYVSYSEIKKRNKEKSKKVPVEEAAGQTLVEEENTKFGLFREGDTIKENEIPHLKESDVDEVEVAKDPVVYRPELAGINTINSYKPDFLTQIGFNRIKKSLKDSVAQGTESDIHGYDPIPAFAYGAEFGQEKYPGSY